MKYLKIYILSLFSMILFISNTNALSCSNSVSKDLGQIASYVKASYEVIDNSQVKTLTVGDNSKNYIIPNFNFEISIYNITEDIYITIKDDKYNSERTVSFSDTNNGTYTFSNDDFGVIYTYNIDIYSANGDCYGEKIKSIKLVKPRYNAYSEYTYCKTSSSLYCQKFVTTEPGIKSNDDFFKKIKINNDKNKPDSKEESSIINSVKSNWKLYLSIFVGVIIITIVVIIIYRKKQMKKKDGWEL